MPTKKVKEEGFFLAMVYDGIVKSISLHPFNKTIESNLKLLEKIFIETEHSTF